MIRQFHLFTPMPTRPPLVVAYGLGVDSTAMLIGLAHRGIRPDLILFADIGGEKPQTYLYASDLPAVASGRGFSAVRGRPLPTAVCSVRHALR